MLDLTPKEINIFASALFDGEGTILLNKMPKVLKNDEVKNYYYVHLRICNKNKKILSLIHKKMNLGKIYCNKIKSGNLYNLHFYGKEAFEFIERIYPYCIVKKTQLDEMKKFSLDLPPEEKESIYKNLQTLKRQEDPKDEPLLL